MFVIGDVPPALRAGESEYSFWYALREELVKFLPGAYWLEVWPHEGSNNLDLDVCLNINYCIEWDLTLHVSVGYVGLRDLDNGRVNVLSVVKSGGFQLKDIVSFDLCDPNFNIEDIAVAITNLPVTTTRDEGLGMFSRISNA